ncbi:MAG TPA: ADOP family duplicated permease, partial [Bryobacteraceae bacterium]|nr:ADOP family duplicated permease [Bryobacteraceae bacterium]
MYIIDAIRIIQDLRLGLRTLLRDPAFSLAAAAVLALGMGATTAIFTLLRGVVLEPMAYPDASRLVYVWSTVPLSGGGVDVLSADDFWEFHDKNRFFSKTAGYVRNSWNATGVGDPVHLAGMMVTGDFFDAIEVRPAMGRAFSADEFHLGRDLEAIFSYQFWQGHLGGDPKILGRKISLDGTPYEVVGIMPPDFPMAESFDVWVPLARDSKIVRGRSYASMRTFGRLGPGINLARARREALDIAADFARRYPEDRKQSFELTTFLEYEIGAARESLWFLAAAVGCLLAIACANVASLLLARGTARVREMAVRAAIGANRSRLIAQTLVESTLLAIAGGIGGTALAVGSVRALLALAPETLPRAAQIHADPRVLAFAFLLTLLTGVVCGIVPALRGSKLNLTEALREGSHGSASQRTRRLRKAFVVAEVAFSVALLATAGLLARSLRALTEARPGFDAHDTVFLETSLPMARYGKNVEGIRSFYERVVKDIDTLPGVVAAGSTSLLPLGTDTNRISAWTDLQPVRSADTKIMIDFRVVTPGYFEAMGVPLVEGRRFNWNDRIDTPHVALVNQAFAREVFHGAAIGHTVTLDYGAAKWPLEIVGVVGDYREENLSDQPKRELFMVENQHGYRMMVLVVRTRGAGSRIAEAVQQAIARVDSGVPIYDVRTLEQQVRRQLAPPRLRGVVFAIFAALA